MSTSGGVTDFKQTFVDGREVLSAVTTSDVEALGSDGDIFNNSDELGIFFLVTFLDGGLLAEETLVSDEEEQSLAFLSQK